MSTDDSNELGRRKDGAGHASTPDPDEIRRVLKIRARALAREREQTHDTGTLDLVEFLLAHETYGVESRFVREVYPLEALTPLPCTPAFVLGIINVRGEILSVIDVRKFFDLPEKGLTDLNKVIILQSDAMLFGVLADAILGVRQIPLSAIQPSLPTLTGIREKYLRGVTDHRIVVLDAGRLLADESIIVQEQVEG